jgi:hypothetical protein
MEQWKEKTNRSHRVTATIMASLFNLFRNSSDQPRSTEDYLPFPPPTPPVHYMTPDEAAFMLAAWTEQAGGTVIGTPPSRNGRVEE